MGRHAAERPGSPPLHSDLFAPAPGSAAARAAQTRAARAFDALVEPHRAALTAYVVRLTDGDEAGAECVVKETLYRAAQDPSRYPQRASAVRPWLVLTARTVLRDGYRHSEGDIPPAAGRPETAGLDDRPEIAGLDDRMVIAGHDDRPTPVPAARRPGPAAATTIMRAMEDLAASHRDVLVELFYRGVSLEDAAAARGVPVETLKSRLYFAMRSLRVVLDQQVADRHGSPER
jgi:RNA polymerase sigma-70 factor (ECF subfamily)